MCAVNHMNWIRPETPVYVLCESQDESVSSQGRSNHRGLLLGKGDCHLAGLRSAFWAVAKVPYYYEIESVNGGCVGFSVYEIVFEGKRPEVIRALIEYGPHGNEISVPN